MPDVERPRALPALWPLAVLLFSWLTLLVAIESLPPGNAFFSVLLSMAAFIVLPGVVITAGTRQILAISDRIAFAAHAPLLGLVALIAYLAVLFFTPLELHHAKAVYLIGIAGWFAHQLFMRKSRDAEIADQALISGRFYRAWLALAVALSLAALVVLYKLGAATSDGADFRYYLHSAKAVACDGFGTINLDAIMVIFGYARNSYFAVMALLTPPNTTLFEIYSVLPFFLLAFALMSCSVSTVALTSDRTLGLAATLFVLTYHGAWFSLETYETKLPGFFDFMLLPYPRNVVVFVLFPLALAAYYRLAERCLDKRDIAALLVVSLAVCSTHILYFVYLNFLGCVYLLLVRMLRVRHLPWRRLLFLVGGLSAIFVSNVLPQVETVRQTLQLEMGRPKGEILGMTYLPFELVIHDGIQWFALAVSLFIYFDRDWRRELKLIVFVFTIVIYAMTSVPPFSHLTLLAIGGDVMVYRFPHLVPFWLILPLGCCAAFKQLYRLVRNAERAVLLTKASMLTVALLSVWWSVQAKKDTIDIRLQLAARRDFVTLPFNSYRAEHVECDPINKEWLKFNEGDNENIVNFLLRFTKEHPNAEWRFSGSRQFLESLVCSEPAADLKLAVINTQLAEQNGLEYPSGDPLFRNENFRVYRVD